MLGDIFKSVLDIIYPATCVTCGQKLKSGTHANKHVCAKCWSRIKKNLPPFCRSCGRQLKEKKYASHICPSCIKTPLHFDRAFSPCSYEGVIKDLIHEFKYKGKDYLGQALSRLLIDFIKEYQMPMQDIDAIVPVPLHAAKLREREFNQAEILGHHIAGEFNKKLLSGHLVRNRKTLTQTELKNEERFLNVKDSFSVNEQQALKGKNILLVDDVITTAATSSEAARALKGAGANIVFVLTLAN